MRCARRYRLGMRALGSPRTSPLPAARAMAARGAKGGLSVIPSGAGSGKTIQKRFEQRTHRCNNLMLSPTTDIFVVASMRRFWQNGQSALSVSGRPRSGEEADMSVRIVAHGSSRTSDFRCETGTTKRPNGGPAGAVILMTAQQGDDRRGPGRA